MSFLHRHVANVLAITASLSLMAAIAVSQTDDRYTQLLERMVQQQIAARGVKAPEVLRALREVPRHLFVPRVLQSRAYDDTPLPIGEGQTISQPYIVALMTELLEVKAGAKILEIGTGSGYQAAILSRLAGEVYTIEIVPSLAREAENLLKILGFANVTVRAGDGYAGWPEKAPFDRIIVTAAPPEVPPALVAQLKRGGRMVLPVGESGGDQQLLVIDKDMNSDKITERKVTAVRFVPMVRQPRQ